MTRSEHLAWAKQRALEYCDRGEIINAWSSLASDLNKHPELETHPAIMTGMEELWSGKLGTKEGMRKFIEGFK